MRGPTVGYRGMVASSHPAVSQAGVRVLEEGGNAVDAALAMTAMSWLVLPSQTGIGGDAFALLRSPDGTVTAYGGSGFGPDGGEPGFYRERGLTAVPTEGPLAVAVPGAVAALAALHADSASWDLPRLWEPAATAAERGMPCTHMTHRDIVERRDVLSRDPGAASVFLPGGKPLGVGAPIRQPDLAATLRRVAAEPSSFYTGDLAERAVSSLSGAGAPFSGDEWAASGEALVAGSLTCRYQGVTVHQTPPPAPGWMVLQQACLNDGRLSELPWLSAEAVSWMGRTWWWPRTWPGRTAEAVPDGGAPAPLYPAYRAGQGVYRQGLPGAGRGPRLPGPVAVGGRGGAGRPPFRLRVRG